MAEETKNIYKYKGEDMDRDLLVKNLRHNVQNYMNNRGWDESKRKEFSDAYEKYISALENGRLSSTDLGNILDSAGELDNGVANYRDKNGKVLSQEEYNALKKRKRKGVTNDFYANREVATYIDKVANSVYNHTKKEPEAPTKFDYGTHGLWNQFKRSLNPTGNVDIQAWWNYDPYDTENKTRGTQNRANYLNNYINTYRDQLAEGLDFSETPVKTREAYLKQLTDLQEELKNGVDDADYRLLSAMGIDPEEYRTFFNTTSKDYDPNNPIGTSTGEEETTEETDEQRQAREEEEKLEKRRSDLEKIWNQKQSVAQSRNYQNHNRWNEKLAVDMSKTEEADRQKSFLDNWHDQKLPEINNFFSTASAEAAAPYLEQFNTYYGQTFNTIQYGPYKNWKYLPGSFNDQYDSVLAYDPNTHNVRRIWMGDIWDEQVKNEYRGILENLYDTEENSGNPFSLQNGGYISIGESRDLLNEVGKSSVERSKQTKADPKRRQLQKEATDYSDNQLTKTDIARLGAIGADIAALIDPEPISALGLGVASDVTNLVSDINEGYGFFNAAGNFLGNLGLSAVGMIPIFGDAVGSGGKVVKTLIKLAPKVTGTLVASGMLAGLSNSDEIIKSFKKIGKDGVENEMNMEDWRNIGLGIQLVLGGANAAKNVHTVKTLKSAGKTHAMDVAVQDIKTGEPKTLRFGNKEVAEQIKKAGSPEEVNKIINRYNSLNGRYTVATRETTTKSADTKWYKPWTWFKKEVTTTPVKNYTTEAFDFNGVRRALNRERLNGFWNNRARYIARHEPTAWSNTPTTINSRPANPKSTGKTTSKSTSTSTKSSTAPQSAGLATKSTNSTTKLTRTDVAALRSKASAHYKKLSNRGIDISKSPHSAEGQKLIDAGYKPETLRKHGLWKQGGKIGRAKKIIKAAGGDTTRNFNMPVSYSDENYGAWRRNPLILPQTYSTMNGRRNYGGEYKSSIENYRNKEYGTESSVDLSKIETSDPGTRSKNLSPAHKGEGYNYRNAQENTDKARSTWQADENNRLNDFSNWARAWYKKHPEGTQSQMLTDYNNAIDSMYKYKREMSTTKYSGENSYRQGEEVRKFNRTNKAIYGSANAIGGVHGYDVGSENINGTTTAQRFIDITDKDLADLDWSKTFKESDTEEFRNLFRGLVKDTTGRYYTQEGDILYPTVNSPVSSTETPTPTPTGTLSNDTETELVGEPKNTSNKTPFDWQSIYTGIAPDILAIGRYLAARNLNKNLLNIAKNMPVMLYNPKERYLWQRGDHTAIQKGYKALGQLNHLAAQPFTADAAQQQAATIEANIKGQPYVNQGYATNDTMAEKTKQASWTQEGENQDSRYGTAMKNRENLFNHRVGILEALGNYKRSNYESLNGLLSEYEDRFRTRQEDNAALQDNLMKASIENRIMSNLGDYNVSAADQELFNSVQNGERQYTDLSDAERAIYDRISSMISERVTQEYAISKGLSYTPYITPARKGSRDTIEVIGIQRQGGVLDGDNEKVTIQKLRAKVSKMAVRQRQLEARLNAYEKDMERSYKSASQYVKSQKKSK